MLWQERTGNWGRRAVSGVALLGLLSAAPARPQTLNPQQKATAKAFLGRVKAYLDKEHGLPASQLKSTADVNELERRRTALREAVQQSRPNAHQGEFFTPDAADLFRLLLGHTMAGSEGGKIRASLAHAEPMAPATLKVNVVYPNTEGRPLQSVPPTLLADLPILPKGLEYRVAGRFLILRDTEANLVVDFLPDAMP